MEISQEFFQPEKLRINLPKFVIDLRGFFNREDAPSQDFSPLPAANKVERKLNKVSYADIRETEIFIPAGMMVTYPEYVNTLKEAVDSASRVHQDILEPVSRWLGIMLSDPREVMSARGHGLENFAPHNIDKHYSDLGNCFQKGSNRNKVKAKEVIKRNKDLAETFEVAEEMTGNFIRANHKNVVESTEEITDLLQRFIERFEEGEDGYDIPKQHLEFLSKVGYTLAQEVEFYSVVNYQLTTLTKSLKDTVGALDV